MHSLSPGSNYIIHTITYILLFLGQIICSRNTCHSRKYLVISALVIGSREIIPEHFEHVTHAQACQDLSFGPVIGTICKNYYILGVVVTTSTLRQHYLNQTSYTYSFL